MVQVIYGKAACGASHYCVIDDGVKPSGTVVRNPADRAPGVVGGVQGVVLAVHAGANPCLFLTVQPTTMVRQRSRVPSMRSLYGTALPRQSRNDA